MPHHNESTANTPPDRPVTHQKNATAHPGTDAQIVFKNPVKSGYWVPNMVTETLTG